MPWKASISSATLSFAAVRAASHSSFLGSGTTSLSNSSRSRRHPAPGSPTRASTVPGRPEAGHRAAGQPSPGRRRLATSGARQGEDSGVRVPGRASGANCSGTGNRLSSHPDSRIQQGRSRRARRCRSDEPSPSRPIEAMQESALPPAATARRGRGPPGGTGTRPAPARASRRPRSRPPGRRHRGRPGRARRRGRAVPLSRPARGSTSDGPGRPRCRRARGRGRPATAADGTSPRRRARSGPSARACRPAARPQRRRGGGSAAASNDVASITTRRRALSSMSAAPRAPARHPPSTRRRALTWSVWARRRTPASGRPQVAQTGDDQARQQTGRRLGQDLDAHRERHQRQPVSPGRCGRRPGRACDEQVAVAVGVEHAAVPRARSGRSRPRSSRAAGAVPARADRRGALR